MLQDTKLIHRNLLHSYMLNNKRSEREIKETNSCSTATRRIKYLGIDLLNEAKDLYTENYKLLMKEIKDNTNRWRDIPCSWIGGINMVKMTLLPKATLRFNVIPFKLPMTFFTDSEHKMSQFCMESQKPWTVKAILRNKMELEQSGTLTLDYATKLSKLLCFSNQDWMALTKLQ